MNLSKREHFLIRLVLFCFLWALALKGVILPEYEQIMNTRRNLAQLREEKARTDLYLEHFPDLKERLAHINSSESEGFFYQDLEDVFMDRKLQDMAVCSGMEIRRMSIGRPADAAGGMEGENRILAVTVTMEVKCADVSNVMEFADQVYRESRSLVISCIDLETDDGDGSESTGLSGIVEAAYYYEETK